MILHTPRTRTHTRIAHFCPVRQPLAALHIQCTDVRWYLCQIMHKCGTTRTTRETGKKHMCCTLACVRTTEEAATASTQRAMHTQSVSVSLRRTIIERLLFGIVVSGPEESKTIEQQPSQSSKSNSNIWAADVYECECVWSGVRCAPNLMKCTNTRVK